MNSDQILDALNEIAADSSKKQKAALVKKNALGKESDLWLETLRLAYDPFVVFGLLPKADDAGTGELMFDEVDTLEFLKKLNDRDLTGNAARDALRSQLAQLSQKSGELLIRILRKDLRAGFGEKTINEAVDIGNFIPVFPYQRCSLPKDTDLSKWPWEKGVFSQEKADGMYANGTNFPDKFFLSSRQGTPLPMEHFESLSKDMHQLIQSVQYHGELLVERDGQILPREIGNGILNSVAKGGAFAENEKPIYLIWDFIPLSAVKAKGKFEVPYSKRYRLLETMLQKFPDLQNVRLIETRIVHSIEEAYEHFFELLRKGKEGTIGKHPDGTWKDGTSKDQVKLKLEADCELVVTAINEGKAGSKNEGRAGAFACQSACGKLVVDVAVKNEKMRDEVDKAPDDWIGRIVTVRSNQILKPSASNSAHSLFLPRMVEEQYRTDKTEADDLERIQDQFDNAIQGK